LGLGGKRLLKAKENYIMRSLMIFIAQGEQIEEDWMDRAGGM
jgi:hypothetical protein